MAQNGDGSIGWISQSSQMDSYWSNVRLMFQRIRLRKPRCSVEPDFLGYVESKVVNSGNDASAITISVNDQSGMLLLPDTVPGYTACILAMRNTYAPKALIGFGPAFWSGSAQTIASFMHSAGVQNADFIVAGPSDRDTGCFEEALRPKLRRRETSMLLRFALAVAMDRFTWTKPTRRLRIILKNSAIYQPIEAIWEEVFPFSGGRYR